MRPSALLLLALAAPACRRDPPPPAEPAPTASAVATASAPDAGAVHVLDEGREPRAVTTFAFVPGRKEARLLAIDTHLELKSRPRLDEHVELRFDLLYSAPDTLSLTLRHAETTASDIPGISTTLGAVFVQKFGKDGTADPPVAKFPPGAVGTATQYVEGAVTQLAATFLPPFPSTPVGEGARWRFGDGESPVYELVSRKGGQIVVRQTVEIRGPHRLDDGKVVRVNEDHDVRIETPLDGIARHVEGALVVDRDKGTKRTTHIRVETIDTP